MSELNENSEVTETTAETGDNPTPNEAPVTDENTDISGDQAADATENNESDDDGGNDDGAVTEYSVDDFTLPEGMEMDTAMYDAVAPVAKELRIDKDGMQKLVTTVAEQKVQAQEAQMNEWEQTRSDWRDQVKADKEIGGNDMPKKMAIAERAMNEFGSKELKEFGEQYGFTDNPEFVRMMYRIGQFISEGQAGDKIGNPAPQKTTVADRWYGSSEG